MTEPGATQVPVAQDGAADAVAFTTDSARFACGGASSTIEINPTRAGLKLDLPSSGFVSALSFSPDGKSLAAGDFDTVKIWAVDGTAAAGPMVVHLQAQQSVNWVRYSPDGTKLIAATDTHVAVLNPHAPDPPLAAWDLDEKISALDLSRDGVLLAAAVDQRHGSDHRNAGYAVVYDLTTRAERCRLTPTGAVHAVAFSPDGARLLCAYADDPTGAADGSVAAFTTSAGQTSTAPRKITDADGWRISYDALDLAYGDGPGGPVVLLGGAVGTAVVLDAQDQTEITRSEHDGAVTHVALASNGSWAASVGIDGFVRAFNATAQGSLYERAIPEAHSLAFSPDGRWLAVGHVSGAWLLDNTAIATAAP